MNAAAIAAFGLLLLTHGGHFYAADAYTTYLTGNAALSGRLDIDQTLGTVRGNDGLSYGMYTIGLPLLMAPFSFLGALIDARWPTLFGLVVGPSVSTFYPENFSIFLASLVFPIFGALTVAAFWGLAEASGYRPSVAAALTAMLLLATQLWPASRDGFPQIVVAFCLVSVAFHLLSWRDAAYRSTPIAAGAIFGLCLLVRPFDALLAAPAILLLAVVQDWPQLRAASDPLAPRAVRFWLPVALSAAVIAILNAARFGNPLTLVPEGQTTIAFNHPIVAGLLGLLFNGRRGLLLYSPPVLLGLWGIARLARRRPALGGFALLLIASYLVAYARYVLWNEGVSWGARFLVPIIPFLILPIGDLLEDRSRRAVVLCAALFVAGLLVQLAGTAVDFHHAAGEGGFVTGTGEHLVLLDHWRFLLAGEHIDLLPWRMWTAGQHLLALLYVLPGLALATFGLNRLRLAMRDGTPDAHFAGVVEEGAHS